MKNKVIYVDFNFKRKRVNHIGFIIFNGLSSIIKLIKNKHNSNKKNNDISKKVEKIL